MLVLPFAAFLGIVLFGKRMRKQGAELAVGAMGVNLLWASVLFVQNMLGGIHREVNLTIADIGRLGGVDLSFELGFVVDGLSIMMYWVVAFVGFLVFVYAVGYMEGDVRVPWFFASLSLFAGSMLVLVGAPNLIQLIIGWEGVGLASYLLIGHYWEQKENSNAAVKAFLTNKVADVGLILGAILIGVSLGGFRFSDLSRAAAEHSHALEGVAFAGGLLLFLGAMGKSAQFPLHVWLPDAMGRPHPGLGPHARRHDGHRRHLPDGPHLPALPEPGRRGPSVDDPDRGDHPVRAGVPGADGRRPQAGAGLFDRLAAGLHDGRRWRRADTRPGCSTCSPTPSSRPCCSSVPDRSSMRSIPTT